LQNGGKEGCDDIRKDVQPQYRKALSSNSTLLAIPMVTNMANEAVQTRFKFTPSNVNLPKKKL